MIILGWYCEAQVTWVTWVSCEAGNTGRALHGAWESRIEGLIKPLNTHNDISTHGGEGGGGRGGGKVKDAAAYNLSVSFFVSLSVCLFVAVFV